MSRFKLLIIYITLLFFIPTTTYAKTIGVIVPLQHNAMNEIVAGIHEILDPILSLEDKIIVKNANGDPNMQRQIIQQMRDNDVDIFVPIGMATSLMTISIVKTKPIVATAAMIDFSALKPRDKNRISVIHDEIDVTHLLKLIKSYMPEIKNVGFIYSNSEKIFPEIAVAKQFCAENNLGIALRKVDTIAEVYQFTESMIADIDAIIILKDHTVVSAISGIAKLAKKYQKPVFALDEGSVQGGAHIALGVPEKQIGKVAAQAISNILKDNKKEAYRVIKLTKFSIFYNELSIKDQQLISIDLLEKIADKSSYNLVPVQHNKR